MKKILITTSSFNTDIPAIRSLESAGYEIMLNPYKRRLKEEEVKDLLTPDVIGMIAGVEPLTRDVLKSAENLSVISRCGIGMDSVDLSAAKEKNILVTNTPDAPTRAVAELTIGLILDCLRGVPAQDRAIRSNEWVRPMGGLLGARTLGLIGYGRIGKKVAHYAKAFGADIIAYDPMISTADDGTKIASFDDVISEADIISLHIPYTDENKHIIDANTLSKMKQGSILINASRGGLVDEDALYNALQNGPLSAAALDVYEEEPYTGKLRELDNIVLAAHVGSYAAEARAEQESLAAENLLAALISDQKDAAHG